MAIVLFPAPSIKNVQIFRYRESVIGDCLNLHQIDGKIVETNSRILMKNLQKAKQKQSSTSSSLTSSSLSNSTSKNLSSLNGEEVSSANEDEPSQQKTRLLLALFRLFLIHRNAISLRHKLLTKPHYSFARGKHWMKNSSSIKKWQKRSRSSTVVSGDQKCGQDFVESKSCKLIAIL